MNSDSEIRGLLEGAWAKFEAGVVPRRSSEMATIPALAGMIDHTLLGPKATKAEIEAICVEAREHHFCSVCVNPVFVPTAHGMLDESGVLVCTVIGFPLGANSTKTKVFETREAISEGADEIDMVIHQGALLAGEWSLVRDDIASVVQAAQGRTVKVILETAALDQRAKIAGCVLSSMAGANFVKTSTGFGPGGATVEDIALMRAIVGDSMGVKASGGIRNRETAIAMVSAGASRIGASASVAIIGAGTSTAGY